MGAVSIFGGIAGLRLPETLHQKLPQTLEEGEAFGSDWSVAQCTECIPKRYSYAFCFNFLNDFSDYSVINSLIFLGLNPLNLSMTVCLAAEQQYQL